ncbi:MAG: hypothetical protein AAFQ51_08430 [Pseudomonadota bacterium]
MADWPVCEAQGFGAIAEGTPDGWHIARSAQAIDDDRALRLIKATARVVGAILDPGIYLAQWSDALCVMQTGRPIAIVARKGFNLGLALKDLRSVPRGFALDPTREGPTFSTPAETREWEILDLIAGTELPRRITFDLDGSAESFEAAGGALIGIDGDAFADVLARAISAERLKVRIDDGAGGAGHQSVMPLLSRFHTARPGASWTFAHGPWPDTMPEGAGIRALVTAMGVAAAVRANDSAQLTLTRVADESPLPRKILTVEEGGQVTFSPV